MIIQAQTRILGSLKTILQTNFESALKDDFKE